MRTIKFRAWDIENNCMANVWGIRFEAWREGMLKYVDIQRNGTEIVPEELVILMQYTSIKDVKGVEIFEGDIAISVYGIGSVICTERGFRFEFDTDSDGLWEMATGIEGKSFEVVGNIYENSELLK